MFVRGTYNTVSLSKFFFFFQNRNKHLESHIKGITQLEKPIRVNYSNNLPDGISFPTLGGSELEYLTKDRLTPLRKCVPRAWRVGIKY